MLEFIQKQFKEHSKILLIGRSIIVFFIFWYSTFLQYIPVLIFHLNVRTLSDQTKILLSLFSSTMLVIIFSLIYQKDLKKEFSTFKNNIVECMDIGVRWWFLGLFLMVTSNLFITFVLHGDGASNEKIIQRMVETLPWVMLFDAGVLAPFIEEIVFRKTLKDIISNKWIFALCSFLLFGGAHVIGNIHNIIDVLYIFPYGVFGATFALAYSESDTIFTSMSMHAIHNTILMLLSIFML